MVLVFLFYLALPVVQVILFLSNQFFLGDLGDILNFISSILALHWMLANVIISSKVPWLQKLMPYDARIRTHILSSIGIVLTVLYHAIYKIALGFYIDAVSWALLAVIALLLLIAVLWIPVPGFRRIRNWVGKNIKKGSESSYESNKSLHGFLVLVFGFLIMLHILNSDLLYGVPSISIILYVLLYSMSFGLYLISKTRIFGSRADVLYVDRKREIITIYLKPKKPLRYISGQFAFVSAKNSKGKWEEHPFSFLSFPGEAVSFAVRACGDFTEHLANLQPGDKIWIRGSFGRFFPKKEDALCLIASGIGSVPLISILKDLYDSGDHRRIELFLAVNHEDEIPEQKKLLNIASSMKNLNLHTLVFEKDGLLYSKEFFQERLADPRDYSYYICSSSGVRSIILDALYALGVKKRAVHYEAFSFG